MNWKPLLCASLLITTSIAAACGEDNEDNPDTVDISGAWTAIGYACDSDTMAELIDFEQEDDSLLGTKIVGDNCVGDGEETIRASFDEVGPNLEHAIDGEIYLGPPVSEWSDGTLTVTSEDRFEFDPPEDDFTITFERTSTAGLDSVDLTGNWIGYGYGCDAETPDTQEMEITAEGSSLTTTKLTGDNCIGEGEVTWTAEQDGTEFDATIKLLDNNGDPIDADATITVLSTDFLRLTGSDFTLDFLRVR